MLGIVSSVFVTQMMVLILSAQFLLAMLELGLTGTMCGASLGSELSSCCIWIYLFLSGQDLLANQMLVLCFEKKPG